MWCNRKCCCGCSGIHPFHNEEERVLLRLNLIKEPMKSLFLRKLKKDSIYKGLFKLCKEYEKEIERLLDR